MIKIVNNYHTHTFRCGHAFGKDEEKFIEKLSKEDKPEFLAESSFKEMVDVKIKDKIQVAQDQRKDQEIIKGIPKKIKWRLYCTWFLYAVWCFLVLFLIGFCTNIFTWTINVQQKYTYLDQNENFGNLEKLMWNPQTFFIDDDNEVKERTGSLLATLSPLFGQEEETYRFWYKNKNLPKLDLEYLVYRHNGVMIRSKTLNQYLKTLQIWDVALKNLSDLKIVSFELEDEAQSWYIIDFDAKLKRMDFYSKDRLSEPQTFTWELPSKKQIIKTVDKQLKDMNISIKNYGDGEVNYDNYDINWLIHIFYPLKIQWYNVRSAITEEQEWISVFYNLNTQTIWSVTNIDVASYEWTNYSTINKADIESSIEKWWDYYSQWALHEWSTVVMLDSMEMVYVDEQSIEDGNHYFIPAIRWVVSSSMENYDGPDMIFQKIIQ